MRKTKEGKRKERGRIWESTRNKTKKKRRKGDKEVKNSIKERNNNGKK